MRRALTFLVALGLLTASCSTRSERQTVLPPLPSSIPRAETTVPSQVAGCQLTSPDRGAEVQRVMAGSAADGVLQAGDVIVEFAGTPIETAADLVAAVRSSEPSDQVELRVERSGEDLTVEVTLGESPDVAGRAMLGVEVVTPIVTYSPANLPVAPSPVLGPFVRGTEIDGILYLLDPVPGRWQPYSDAPGTPWAAMRNGIYTIRPEGFDNASVDLVGTEFETTLQTAEWGVPVLVSSVAGLGIAIARPRSGSTDLPETAVLAIDPQAGTVVWTWPDDSAEESPLFAFASPSHDRVVVLLGAPESQVATSHAILDAQGVEVTGWPDQGRFLPPGSLVIGWFDEDSLLYAVPPGAGVFTFNMTSRESAPLTIPGDVGPGTVLWAVGDGRHLMALTQETLLLLDTVGSEARPLALGCLVDGVGDAGGLTG